MSEKPRCGARGKRTGLPCRLVRGDRTDHPGAGRCWLHGGRTPNGRRFAAREAAANVLRELRIDVDVDPISSLYEAVRVAAWREIGLRQMLEGRAVLYGPDHLGDLREDIVAQMHREALDARARIAKMAVDAGLDERMVRLAERQADILVQLVEVVLEAAGAADEARERGRSAASAFLAATAEVEAREPAGSRN